MFHSSYVIFSAPDNNIPTPNKFNPFKIEFQSVETRRHNFVKLNSFTEAEIC